MARYFRAEPGVVKLESDGAAVMFNGSESWPVKARHVVREMNSPELTQDEFESVLEGLRKAAGRRRRRRSIEDTAFEGAQLARGAGHLH